MPLPVRLYDFALAPNPRRVRIFLAEKGVEIPLVEVNTRERAQFSESFKKLGSGGKIPVLELDDGTMLSETVAICRYIEALHPQPVLMGHDDLDKCIVEMWQRRVELEGYNAAGDAVRNSLPMFEDRSIAGVESGFPQIPALAERGKAAFGLFLNKLNEQLRGNAYIAGRHFTIADITALVTIDFAKRADISVPDSMSHVLRWYEEVSNRPSAAA
jgi:glutathione S-transferase